MSETPERLPAGECGTKINRDVVPAGWWTVFPPFTGVPQQGWYAVYSYGDEHRVIDGFDSREAATRATWETPECDHSGAACPAPGHGDITVERL